MSVEFLHFTETAALTTRLNNRSADRNVSPQKNSVRLQIESNVIINLIKTVELQH